MTIIIINRTCNGCIKKLIRNYAFLHSYHISERKKCNNVPIGYNEYNYVEYRFFAVVFSKYTILIITITIVNWT